MSFLPIVGLQQSSTRTGVKKSLRSESELGYIFTRTSMLQKQKFSLNFLFSTSDCNTLETFFYSNKGNNFNLVYDSVTYTCIFISDGFAIKKVSKDYREVTLDLREL